MPLTALSPVRISGLTVCTGPLKRTLEDEAALFQDAPEQLDKVRNFVGIETRYLAPTGITTLDLAEQAVQRLLAGDAGSEAPPDALIFVTQTPDYFQPCNANILHGRLGLPSHTAAFDVNQGCSGWVYGFWLAASLIAAGSAQRVLLLAGDTVTQKIHPRDRATRPLFSDACSATLVERGTEKDIWSFEMASDGKGYESICIPGGAHRGLNKNGQDQEETDADGNVRTPSHLFMNGLEVFNFTLREEPKAVRQFMETANLKPEDVDALVFHQANRFILQNLAKRLGFSMGKVPHRTLRDFGNQSSASIPAALCHDLGEVLATDTQRILCSGFGVGLSWATCYGKMGPLKNLSIFPFS